MYAVLCIGTQFGDRGFRPLIIMILKIIAQDCNWVETVRFNEPSRGPIKSFINSFQFPKHVFSDFVYSGFQMFL